MYSNVEIYIAFVATIIAGCALAVTIWQGRQNLKHNKLSVRPFLAISEIHDTGRGFIAFKLKNCGVGPAIIKNFILLFGDREVSHNNREDYKNFLNNLLKDFMEIQTGHCVPGAVIEVGVSYQLLSFRYNKGKANIDFIHKLNLIVDYQSIYEDEIFTYDSRKARFFDGREDK